jgi:hypothetical protein
MVAFRWFHCSTSGDQGVSGIISARAGTRAHPGGAGFAMQKAVIDMTLGQAIPRKGIGAFLFVVVGMCFCPGGAPGQGANDGSRSERGKTGAQGTEAANANGCGKEAAVRAGDAGCYATVQAAVAALPVTGGKVSIPPGNYPCPDDFVGKSNIQLIGESYDPPAERGHGINSSWLSYPDQKAVLQCSSTWVIDSSNGLVIEGVQIQMVGPHGGDGLVLKAVTNSKFSDFSIIGNGSGEKGVGLRILGLGSTGTNSSRNTFQNFLISGFNDGAIALSGSTAANHCVTANDFRNAWFTSGSSPTGPAIGLGYCVDSNYWYNITATNLGNRQSALVVNDTGHRNIDEDSGGNAFFGITVQPADPGRYTGSLFQFNRSHGTEIEGASITGGLAKNIDREIVGAEEGAQFRLCFASNFSMPSNSSSCINQVSYLGVNDASNISRTTSATLYSVPAEAAGFYRVYGEIWTTALGTGNVTFSVYSNIGGYNAGQTTAPLSLSSQNGVSFTYDVFAAGGTNITYRTSYTPSGAYGLRLRIAYEPQGN